MRPRRRLRPRTTPPCAAPHRRGRRTRPRATTRRRGLRRAGPRRVVRRMTASDNRRTTTTDHGRRATTSDELCAPGGPGRPEHTTDGSSRAVVKSGTVLTTLLFDGRRHPAAKLEGRSQARPPPTSRQGPPRPGLDCRIAHIELSNSVELPLKSDQGAVCSYRKCRSFVGFGRNWPALGWFLW